MFVASVALAGETPLVVAQLPMRESHAQIVDAVCELRIPGVDVSIDGRRCTFGFAEPASVPLTILEREGVLVFEGHIDPELVRAARASVALRLELGAEDYRAGTWVTSTWRPRSDALRDGGIVALVFGGVALLTAALLAATAYATEHPLCLGFSFDAPPCVPGDGSSAWIASGVAVITGFTLTTIGVGTFTAGRMKVAVIPTSARVTF